MSARDYARQARLAEVGVEGQAKIASARVRVEGAAAARAVAEAYLERAGVGTEEAAGVAFVVRCQSVALAPGPAEIASGSLAALVALRARLGLGTPEDALVATETDAARDV